MRPNLTAAASARGLAKRGKRGARGPEFKSRQPAQSFQPLPGNCALPRKKVLLQRSPAKLDRRVRAAFSDTNFTARAPDYQAIIRATPKREA